MVLRFLFSEAQPGLQHRGSPQQCPNRSAAVVVSQCHPCPQRAGTRTGCHGNHFGTLSDAHKVNLLLTISKTRKSWCWGDIPPGVLPPTPNIIGSFAPILKAPTGLRVRGENGEGRSSSGMPRRKRARLHAELRKGFPLCYVLVCGHSS